MKIIITENQKKKLFTPKNLSNDENNRYVQRNKEQPIKDGVRINQYDLDGNKTGYWEEYYDDGIIFYKGNYMNGKMNGYWMVYHDNGNLEAKGNYIDGKRDGIWESFDSDGKLLLKGKYVNGKLVISPIKESEQPKKKKLFTPKNLDSRYEQWNKEQPIRDGKPINQYDSKGNKQGVWEYYRDNGKLASKGNYIDGVEQGYWEYYNENGGISGKGNLINGSWNGVWEFYLIDGRLRSKGEYKNGAPNGSWESYGVNGDIVGKYVYKNGNLVKNLPINESEQPKKKKLFTPKGLSNDENNRFLKLNKNQPVKIIDGKEIRINQYDSEGNKQGYWEKYYNDGNLSSRGVYVNNRREGYWEEYGPKGQFLSRNEWNNGEMTFRSLPKPKTN